MKLGEIYIGVPYTTCTINVYHQSVISLVPDNDQAYSI